jgi:methylamine--corrinoid protein Co-methyltransferase|tara:strand:- start:4197 stop:5570 length:1374 start_codon:yes stop_codon:yes gene_type:complete
MKNRGRLVEILSKAETGPIIDEKDFEAILITSTIKGLIDKYELKFDRKTIVPSDDDLTDRIFQAGLEFAVEVGMFCQDTHRRITWTEEEYLQGLNSCPGEMVLGTGNDTVTINARTPESPIPPTFVGGPFGVPVPEDMFVPIMLSYAQEPLIDIIENPTIESVYGHPVKAASPWEVLGGWREAELSFETINRAGRPGMPIGCIETSPTALAQISAASWGGVRPSDWHHVSAPSEFKTNYDLLSKVAHITRIGAHMEAYLNIIYGGFLGGAEGVAIGLAAGLIVVNQNYMGTTISVSSAHPFLHSDATPDSLWAQSLAFQAVSRHSKMLTASLCKPAAGPGTKTLLHECAAFVISGVASGLTVPQASMTATGTNSCHCSGLESRFSAEVAHAAAGMSREQADDIVKKLLAIYEDDLEKGPIGQPFQEVYSMKTLQPTPEWLGIYEDVKNELVEMGVAL